MRSSRFRGGFTALAACWMLSMPAVAANHAPVAGPRLPAACRADVAAPVVLMLLSPRMVNALREWPRMRQTAERAGFAVCSLRDPRIDEPEWRAAANAAGRPEALDLPVLDANAATPGLLNHSPTSLVRLGGRLHPWPIQGVMPDAAWIAVLNDRLDRLRATR